MSRAGGHVRRWAMGLSLSFLATCAGAASPMTLGVQTHFSQGWPISWLAKAEDVGAPAIRDSLPWATAEKQPGRYDFSKGGHIASACRAGLDVLVTLNPVNPVYDHGKVATSPIAQQAYAAYVAALAAHYPCIVGVEVGNEINAPRWFTGGPASELPSAYVGLLRRVRAALPTGGRRIAILGGSTNLIGTGFLERLFAAGMLELVDGVVIHPYRRNAEGVDLEIAGLRAAMRQYGPVKPIWATEFGDYFPTPEDAPPRLIKMVALMSADGVERAYWYALKDQTFFKNMGLFTETGPKPAKDAFQLAEWLLKQGAATRLEAPPGVYLFRFGNAAYVMWGTPRAVQFSGPARIRNARGVAMAGPVTLGDDPVVVTGATAYRFAPSPVVADSLIDFGRTPWSYLLGRSGRPALPMRWGNANWTSRFAAPGFGGFTVDAGAATAATTARPTYTIERYTAPAARTISISACFEKALEGQGMSVSVWHDDSRIFEGLLTERLALPTLAIAVQPGDTIDFRYAAGGTPGGNKLRRRIRLVDGAGVPPVTCG